MSKMNVKLNNIGGLKALNTQLDLGKINIVRGTSSSGKSSLMRGLHLGVVGSVPHQDLYLDEVNALHLNDRNSDQALLHRGAKEGTVEVAVDDRSFKSTIPRSGQVKSSGSNPKGLFTTMLSSLPQTQIHQRVFNPTSDEPNNFKWVVDDFSDAGKYQTWHDVLARVEQELVQLRNKFGNWKDSLSSAGEQRQAIEAELKELRARIEEQAAASGVEASKLEEKITRLQSSVNQKEKEFIRAQTEYRESEAKNKFQMERLKSAQSTENLAKRRLADAEDLLEEGVIEPNIAGFDETIANLEHELAVAQGSEPTDAQSEVMAIHKAQPGSIQPPSLLEALNKMAEEFGDSSALSEVQTKLNAVKKERQDVINAYLDKKRRYGMAEQQAAAARSELSSARQIITDAKKEMAAAGGVGEKEKADLERYKREYEAARAELVSLKGQRSAGGGASAEDTKLETQLMNKLASIENSTTFEVRFTSLGMLASQTLNLSMSDAEKLLNSGDDAHPNTSLVNTHLEKSASEIRSLIHANLTSGVLSSIVATSAWTHDEADRQRQETRRVFNDVGTNLFNRMKFSKINGLQLDANYEIKIAWDTGETTGLTGAGGERTVIAATLLIAMRKAYTPELPLLMFDGVLENLDDGPREEFMKFLDEYAKNEGVAVVVSLLDENCPTPQIN